MNIDFYFNVNEPGSTQAVVRKITDDFGFNKTKCNDLTEKLNCNMVCLWKNKEGI